MKAMVLNRICDLAEEPEPLELAERPIPEPRGNEILIRVSCCGVCHTELDEIEGRTSPPEFPVIPGHQVVGVVAKMGDQASTFHPGDRVGVAWIHTACGHCKFCLNGAENLCPEFVATGRDVNGGYAEFMTVRDDFAYLIPALFSDQEAAPLLCAGAIGYRSLRLTDLQNGQRLGLTGFGASGHLVLKMVKYQYPETEIYVFARSSEERVFAMELGAIWAGESTERAPHKLDSIIDTTPAWQPIVDALVNLEAGGRLVINAIRKEGDKLSLQKLDYPQHLWMEKEIKTVANITRQDVREFLQLAGDMQLKPEIQTFDIKDANQALLELKQRSIRGAKVLLL